jgi:integrase
VFVEFSLKKERWDAGHIHVQQDGRRLWIIERMVGGKRYHVSTRAHSETAAYEQLKEFEKDPEAYVQRMKGDSESAREKPLRMTTELIAEFRTWLLEREHAASWRYANATYHRLVEWIEDLEGADLRKLELKTLHTAMEGRASQKARIIAIKSFFSWLRERKFLIDRKNDPTLDLAVPQAIPEKWKRRKAVPVEHVRKALRKLKGAERDCLLLMANTGWHLSELERFIRTPEPEAGIAPGRGKVLGVLQVRHKIGHTTRTPILNKEALAAAKRLRKRQQVPRWLTKKLKTACRAAGVPEFGFGVLRHSVATWAVEAGTPPEVAAEFLGHKSKVTLLRFYADVAVPTLPVRLPKLA